MPDSAFRRAAIVFLRELDRLIPELESGKLPPEGLETFAHQMRGAAGLFGAKDTEAATSALEQGLRSGLAAAARAPFLAATAAAMRKDAGSLRLRYCDALAPGQPANAKSIVAQCSRVDRQAGKSVDAARDTR